MITTSSYFSGSTWSRFLIKGDFARYFIWDATCGISIFRHQAERDIFVGHSTGTFCLRTSHSPDFRQAPRVYYIFLYIYIYMRTVNILVHHRENLAYLGDDSEIVQVIRIRWVCPAARHLQRHHLDAPNLPGARAKPQAISFVMLINWLSDSLAGSKPHSSDFRYAKGRRCDKRKASVCISHSRSESQSQFSIRLRLMGRGVDGASVFRAGQLRRPSRGI